MKSNLHSTYPECSTCILHTDRQQELVPGNCGFPSDVAIALNVWSHDHTEPIQFFDISIVKCFKFPLGSTTLSQFT
jgi:hypothetical protein